MRRLAVSLALLGVVLAGCSTSAPGPPAPAPVDGAATTEPSSRPREVRLDGLDPCTLLTGADRRGSGHPGLHPSMDGTAAGAREEASRRPSYLVDDCGVSTSRCRAPSRWSGEVRRTAGSGGP